MIQCALTAGAERVVTGDKALLALQTVEQVKIVTAGELLAELAAVH